MAVATSHAQTQYPTTNYHIEYQMNEKLGVGYTHAATVGEEWAVGYSHFPACRLLISDHSKHLPTPMAMRQGQKKLPKRPHALGEW